MSILYLKIIVSHAYNFKNKEYCHSIIEERYIFVILRDNKIINSDSIRRYIM